LLKEEDYKDFFKDLDIIDQIIEEGEKEGEI